MGARLLEFRPWMYHDKDEIEIRPAAAHDGDATGATRAGGFAAIVDVDD